ncbi:MAG: enoyl-CoA hydratase/isomerase family protein [Sphingobacteriales bacterium]|nr:enoyl-CoA hydratase/isomerase family protein [Sphingobacteriales bacterium]
MNYENILAETKDEILWITINRAAKLNALNKATLAELHDAVLNAQTNTLIGGVIISGSGEKAFVAGADISEFSSFNSAEGTMLAKEGQQNVFDLIANSTKPVIAAVNGFALGGGLELAMACHIRIASENAKLGLPEVTLGLIPGYGGTQRLTQLVGRGKALEMILTADMIDAAEAHQLGLINHLVTFEELLPTAEKLMRKILSRSPNAVSAAISAVNAALDSSKNGFEVEIEEFGKCFGTDDFKEGVAAFLEKRKANFKRN